MTTDSTELHLGGGPPRTAAGRGVTLVELLVVMAIVVGLMGAGAYSIGLISQADLKNEVRRLTSAIKYTWSRAAMNNAQYRMVLDLDENSYRTEVTDAPVVADSDSEDDEASEFISEEARRAQQRGSASDEASDEEADDPFGVGGKPTYEQVEASELSKHVLAGDLRIERVIPCNQEEPITEGRAAIHFYPNGFQQPTIIVLQNGKDGKYFSLMTEPLTGQVKVVDEKLETTENCGKPEEIQEEW